MTTTREVICTRCGNTRWPTGPLPALAKEKGWTVAPPIDLRTFVCHRCRAALAGKNATDPAPTPERRAAGARLQARLRATRARRARRP